MWKQVRQLQPAHKGGTFTVAEAARAFRQMRITPKPELFDDGAIVRRDSSGRLMIYDPDPAAVVVADYEKTKGGKSPPNGAAAHRRRSSRSGEG